MFYVLTVVVTVVISRILAILFVFMLINLVFDTEEVIISIYPLLRHNSYVSLVIIIFLSFIGFMN
jgi:hypothetical protein